MLCFYKSLIDIHLFNSVYLESCIDDPQPVTLLVEGYKVVFIHIIQNIWAKSKIDCTMCTTSSAGCLIGLYPISSLNIVSQADQMVLSDLAVGGPV